MLEQQAEERDEVTIGRALAGAGGADIFFQLDKTLARALGVNALILRFLDAVFAKASDLGGVERAAAMFEIQRVEKRALAFRAPHHAADVVGAGVVLHQAEREVAVIRIVKAR